MNHRDRFLVDCDDVLFQFRQRYLNTVYGLFGIEKTVEDTCQTWDVDKGLELTQHQKSLVWKTINKPDWALHLDPMPGAVDAIKRLQQKFEVMVVTKPLKSSPTWVYDRRRSIRKHFGVELSNNIQNTSRKYAIDGNWLVEDNVDHAVQWSEDRAIYSRRRCQAILYAWPYNMDERFHRFASWEAILTYVGV